MSTMYSDKTNKNDKTNKQKQVINYALLWRYLLRHHLHIISDEVL